MLRDLALSAVIFGLLPLAVFHPWIGVMLWTWVSLMNPHKLTWGFAFEMPFAQLIAIATLVGLLISRDVKRFPLTPITCTLLALVAWTCVTMAFALYPNESWDTFMRAIKIQAMLLVTLALVHTKKHIMILVWVIVVSVGFYGVKGGLYTIQTAGGGRVWGPPGGFFFGNNELAVALLMVIPLMVFLRAQAQKIWLKYAMLGAVLLSCLSVLGTQSRGGFLAAGAMVTFLWLHGKKKALTLIPIVGLCAAALAFMPETWWDRMETIMQYEKDGSALGRINAWGMAFNLANDRLLGGGMYVFSEELFYQYAPDKEDVPRAAHSIYFQALGEQGWIGLFLFLLLWGLTWLAAGALQREAAASPGTVWAKDLCAMIKVGLIAYFVGGAFLSLAHFDLPYLLAVLVVVARRCVRQELAQQGAAVTEPTPMVESSRDLRST